MRVHWAKRLLIVAFPLGIAAALGYGSFSGCVAGGGQGLACDFPNFGFFPLRDAGSWLVFLVVTGALPLSAIGAFYLLRNPGRLVLVMLAAQLACAVFVAVRAYSIPDCCSRVLDSMVGAVLVFGALATVGALIAAARARAFRWLFVPPIGAALCVVGLVASFACCFRMGS